MSAALGVLLITGLVAPAARASEDPSDVPPPTTVAPPAEPPPAEPPPADAPPADAPSTDASPADAPPADMPPVDDPLVPCRALVLDDRLDDAERCLQAVQVAPSANASDRARARALLDVVTAWRRHLASLAPAAPATPPTTSAPTLRPAPREQLSITTIMNDGTAEAVVHGTIAGGGAGFLVSAAVASATRASEQDTIGWLVAAPAAGGLVGAAGGYALARTLRPSIGDLRLATSTMWMGATQGLMLQLAVFDQSPDVGAVPLRFITVLAGGAVGLSTGAALAPLVDVDDGDVAVAHSAALWGGVLTTIVMAGAVGALGGGSFPVMVAIAAGGIGVPYVAALAAHPLLDIERWPSLLIDAGGAAGLLIAGALVAVGASSLGTNAPVGAGVLTVGTAAGLSLGSVAAWMVSDTMRAESRALRNDAGDEGVE